MNEPIDLKGRDELESLLPFYLNGTLDGAELERVEAWLADDPAAMAALAEAESEQDASVVANEAVHLPGDALQRFTAALEAEPSKSRAVSAADGAASGVSWPAGIWRRFMDAPPAMAWGAAAAMLAIVVVQATGPSIGPDQTFTEAGIERAGEASPNILVVFAPEATVAEISELLNATGASIIDGPKPGGIYQLGLPVETIAEYDSVSAEIAGSPLTGQVLPGRKPGE